MKAIERKSLWHHTLFSILVCAMLAAVVFMRRDVPTLIFVGVITVYILGNTLLHYHRKDFRTETLYEYILVAAAVLIVLYSAR